MQVAHHGDGTWEPPQEGWAKINVDGSYLEQSGDAGVGAVATDWQESVIFTAWKFVAKCSSALEAEAITFTEALNRIVQEL